MTRRRNHFNKISTKLIIFALIFGICFLGFQFITKTGLFKVPGVVTYDDSLNEEELGALKEIFTEEITLDQDVKISASDYLEKPELKTGDYLYKIEVPVTDFYSSAANLNAENLANLKEKADNDQIKLIDINNLDFTKKLLSVNHKYFLEDFNSGAIFRVVHFESEKFDEEIRPLVDNKFHQNFPEKSTVLSFAQTGVTALSRGVNRKLGEVEDPTYFSANIKDYLSHFDLTHTSNESSFSELATDRNICSNPKFINTLKDIGLNIVELTGNHNQDCGNNDAANTIDTYLENNIKIVGGGKTATEAAKPLQLDEKGNKITFLAYNQSTGGATYGNTPGANQYYEENAKTEIENAKSRGDFVIVDVQYYECSAYVSETEDATCDYADSSAGDQIGFFRHLIDLGADLVVGTSAHQPQTFELYQNGAIYYGLGNLFFDQSWWPGTTRSLILAHYYYNGKLLQTKITPSAYNENYQPSLLDEASTEWFINRLVSARPTY